MRLSKFVKLAGTAMLFSVFLFSCKQVGDKDKKTNLEDPNLTLSYLKLFEEEAKDLNAPKFTVSNDKTTLIATNFIAKFNYGTKTNDEIAVAVAYKEGTSLKVGENKLTLSVAAVEGKHKVWSKEITVTRAKAEDPELTLSYLKLFEEEKTQPTDLENPAFNVPNDKTTVTADNIVAKFNYGDKTNDEIKVAVAYKEGSSLKVGENKLTLSVAAVEGKHKVWSKEITVTRAKAILKPISLKVKTSTSPLKWEFATNTGNDFAIEVPTSITSLTNADIEAYFEWNGMKAPKPRKLDFSVEGNFPIQLEAPGTPKEVKMTVPADVNGEYLEFSNKLTITRKRPEDVQLKKIKLVSSTFTKKEITDLASPSVEIPTNAQSVNVFFYSKADASTEDAELLKKISTEPELQKNGAVKTWKLDNVNNELKVKVDGTVVYTVKVKRNPLLVESIGVYEGGKTIAEDAIEGEIYNTVANTITIAVMPKQINSEGYLVYKAVTVKAGSAPEVSLPQNNSADPTQGFSGTINLTEESTQITVTIKDATEKDEFKLTRTFTIKKEASNPSLGAIDPKVQIAELWVGDGAMDKVDVNKFKAEKDASDEHKYTVHLPKTGYTSKKVALIVKGVATATTADVKDETTATSAKADGTAVFTSKNNYIYVKGKNNKYTFMLENEGKTAVYEITVEFKLELLHTITINQPEHGEIKVYQVTGTAMDRKRTDLQIGADNTLKIKDGYAIYVELIAKDGKTPKKLTLNGNAIEGVTNNVELQTPGAIAKKILFVRKDYTITGECE